MKKYSSPETMSLVVMAHDIICASAGPAPAPTRGQIGNAAQGNFVW